MKRFLVVAAAFGLALLVALLVSDAAALALAAGLAFVAAFALFTGKHTWGLAIIAAASAFLLKWAVV
jgi:hypothetical protein